MRTRLAAALWAVMALALLAMPAWAQDGKSEVTKAAEPAQTPQEIKTGIYILNLGKLDISSGAFTVDFYLSLKSDRPIPENTFEFMNGRASSMEKIEETQKDGVYEKFYRIQANLTTRVDLRKFPFDTQKMEIILEDKKATSDEVRYVPDPETSGLDEDIAFTGWNVLGCTPEVKEHNYKVYDETYSQFIYTVQIERIKFNSFLKTFLPVIFLMLVVMSSFILNPTQIVTRLGAITSTLIASTMFHVSISNQIPPVGYLTFADKFMGVTYLVLLGSFFLSIATFVLQGKGEEAKVKKLQTVSERLVFSGIPVFYIGLFMFMR